MADEIKVEKTTKNINWKDVEVTAVTFGPKEKRRVVEYRETGIEQQFDLAEFAPENASRTWRGMALIAMSIHTIDQAPVLTPRSRDDVRGVLAKLGDDGWGAVMAAQMPAEIATEEDAEAAHRAQVGNSRDQPLSGG